MENSLKIASRTGIKNEFIVLDPGFGFGKNSQDNLLLMSRFSELKRFKLPLLVGISRKRFLGYLTGKAEATARDTSTAVANSLLRMAGATIFRVHNVTTTRDALRIADSMIMTQKSPVGIKEIP